MIGNTIIYISHKWHGAEYESETKQGIVVDAFTRITSTLKGDPSSERMYKVMYYESWDSDKKHPRFDDISADSMSRIVEFGNKSIFSL